MSGKSDDIEERFASLNMWKRGDERAPHKPLLVLLAIGELLRTGRRTIPYEYIHEKLRRLLMEFGPQRKLYHPEFPYWHLQSDGVWQIDKVPVPDDKIGRKSPSAKVFLESRSSGGFTDEVFEVLSSDLRLARRVVQSILDSHFPETVHADILEEIGIPSSMDSATRARRDPKFRETVLRAYEYRCAVCGFSSRLDGVLTGVEAAHIKWHQAGGADSAENGLALCSLHHKLLDRGMLTITDGNRVCVSELANGGAMFRHLVLSFHGKAISTPIRREYTPSDGSVAWHVREVFHGPGRL